MEDRGCMAEQSNNTSADLGECERALRRLRLIVLEGLRHGFFECTVACETIGGRKRRLVIKAGISHQFIIPPQEIEGIS
jgi:hypothetical protein